MIKIGITTLIIIAINIFLSARWGYLVNYESQKEVIEALQSISSVIFGVMGAWIAIVYPDALANILKWENKNNTTQVKAVKKILLPVKVATYVLLYTLLFFWLSPILSKIDFFIQKKDIFLSINYFFIGTSFSMLLIALILSFYPMNKIENEITDKNKKRESLERKRGQANHQ